MESRFLLLAACLLLTTIIITIIVFYFVNFLLTYWNDIKSAKFVWKNKYPSFEELHALFDRGDIMLSTVLIASCLQLSHPALSQVIRAHSTYKTDAWRRTLRTMAFIYIMIRATSSEREAVVRWLRRLHGSIRLFVFESNVFVFATFAYGLVKTHELLGNITPEEVDAVVKAVMSMADKLDPNDRGRKVPNTMAEVEACLRKELSFDVDELREIKTEAMDMGSVWKLAEEQGVGKFLKMPLNVIKLCVFGVFISRIADNVLTLQDHTARSSLGMSLWWCVRKIHCCLSYFHYSICPQMLTFDGMLDLFVKGNPRMEKVPTELYREIFGSKSGAPLDDMPTKVLRNFSDMEAHLPRMEIDEQQRPPIAGFYEDVVELFRCSYYRGKLVDSPGQPPLHLGLIMDGNRRYSRHRKFNSILSGHQVGAHKLLQVMCWAFSSGIHNLTVWALSDDNMKRGPKELNALFSMMAEYIREMVMGDASFSILEIRFRVVGDRSILPDYLNDMIDKAEVASAQNSKFNFQIALGYGGRSEINRATKLAVSAKMLQENLPLETAIERITEADVSLQTYSAQLELPQIDAIIRTSGENRLSGFALWESQHAEFAIIRENWPALRQSTFLRTLLDLSKRNRRFGA